MKFLISQGQAIRSVFGCSLVTHFISFSFRCCVHAGSRPVKEGALAVLVQAVEQRRRESEQLFVVTDHRQAAQEYVEPGRLGRVVALVGQIGLVHDLGDLPEHRVGELVAAQEGLEAAVAAVVGEVNAAHIERGRVRRHLVEVVDKHELGV
jgi:hypothetical protein